jgi:hypothetical protein
MSRSDLAVKCDLIRYEAGLDTRLFSQGQDRRLPNLPRGGIYGSFSISMTPLCQETMIRRCESCHGKAARSGVKIW